MLIKRKSDGPDASAEDLALAALAWMATDDERLFPFLAATGVTPDTLRASAGDPGFLPGSSITSWATRRRCSPAPRRWL